MKYKIAGEIIDAKDLATHPNANFWIKAIQKARKNAIRSCTNEQNSFNNQNFDFYFKQELTAIGVEIIK